MTVRSYQSVPSSTSLLYDASMMPPAPLLKVANVETAYHGRLTVLRGISITVHEHQIVALLGSNGAGKTTLLRTISGLIPDQPEKGSIEFLGQRVNGWDPEAIARLGLGYVLEGRGVFPEVQGRVRPGSCRHPRIPGHAPCI